MLVWPSRDIYEGISQKEAIQSIMHTMMIEDLIFAELDMAELGTRRENKATQRQELQR